MKAYKVYIRVQDDGTIGTQHTDVQVSPVDSLSDISAEWDNTKAKDGGRWIWLGLVTFVHHEPEYFTDFNMFKNMITALGSKFDPSIS